MFTNYETHTNLALYELNSGKIICVKDVDGSMVAIYPPKTHFYQIVIVGNLPYEIYQHDTPKEDIKNLLRRATIITREEFVECRRKLFVRK